MGRPIDLQHISVGLEEAWALTITQDHGYLEARSPSDGNGRLKGAHIVFDKITVTGTEDLLMAAALAEGETVFENCAREPEVSDLAALLIAMGAKIEGAGSSTIKVRGVAKLHGARHRINPDRIEAGTFLLAGAITGGDLNVDCCNPAHLGALIAKLEECGVRIKTGKENVRVRSGGALRRPGHLHRGGIPASPPTCRRSSWRWLRRPKALQRSPRTSSRTASCTCRSSTAWAEHHL